MSSYEIPNDLPNAGFINYLASYTPVSANKGAFDEHVSKQANKNNVKPLHFDNGFLDEICAQIEACHSGVYIVAGTAGDGKTYLCRSVWKKLNEKGMSTIWEKGWKEREKIHSGMLSADYNGTTIICIKDLSEVSDDSAEENKAIDLLLNIIFNNDPKILLIAANDGRLIEKLKKYKTKQHSAQAYDLLEVIEDFFIKHKVRKINNFKIYDLRRLITADYITSIIQNVLQHEAWNKCLGCSCINYCPIINNVKYLRENDFILKRFKQIFSIIIANGLHITIRNALLFITNMLLGISDQSLAKSLNKNILNCGIVKTLQNNNYYSNIFINMLGYNLKPSARDDKEIFSYLDSLKIGLETNKRCDSMLMYGTGDSDHNDVYEKYIKATKYHQLDIGKWEQVQKQYLERTDFDFRDYENYSEVDYELQTLRRCLFFTLDNRSYCDKYCPWDLTLYTAGAQYMTLYNAVRKNPEDDKKIRNFVATLTLGLNRLFTGMFFPNANYEQTEDNKKLYIAVSGGYVNSGLAQICLKAVPYSALGIADSFGIVCSNDEDKLPTFEIRLQQEHGLVKVTFKLTPLRFEFISRIAAGYLPTSFSNECLEDVQAFKANLIFAIEHSKQENVDKISLIRVDREKINLKTISIDSGLTEEGNDDSEF